MPQLLPQQLHRHHHDIRRVQDHLDSEDQDADGEDAPPTSHPTQQSYHHIPTFNLLIVGRPRTGKTALTRLLVDTSTLAPAISPSRINHLADYANASIRPTSAITCATAELCATPKRSPVTLNIFDTPGIDFQDQAAFEASITLIHRHISDTYRASEDLPEHAQADHQVHLCLYVLDPDVIIPERTRNHHPPPAVAPVPARASMGAHASPVATRPRGGSDASTTRPPAVELAHYDDDPETGWARATLPQGELRVIRNLAERVNLLPIIGKADTLTAERLEAVKMAVRRDLQERGLTLGLIDPDETRQQLLHQLHQPQTTSGGTHHASAARAPPGHPTGPPPPAPRTYSAMPFAVMAPDRYLHGDGASQFRGSLRFTHSQLVQQYQAQVAAPNTVPQDIYVSPYIKPERVYRWGSLDVLDPLCSDFRQMRTMVFDNNLMGLREHTHRMLFAKYRSESVGGRRRRPTSSEDSGLPHAPSMSQAGSSGPGPFPNSPPYPPPHAQAAAPPPRYPGSVPRHQLSVSPTQPRAVPGGPPPPLSYHPDARGPPGSMVLTFEQEPDTLIAAPKLKPVARKISVACNFCRSRKLKCDGGKPQCQQCIRRKVVCEYDTNVKRRGLARSTQNPEEAQGIEVRERPMVNPKAVACQFCRSRKTKCDGRLPRCGNCEKRDQSCSYNYGGHSPEAEAGPAAASPPTATAHAASATSAGGVLPPIHSLPIAAPATTASGPSGSSGPPETLYLHYPAGSHPQQLPPPHGIAHASAPTSGMPPPLPGAAPGISRGSVASSSSSLHRLPPIVDQPRRTSGDSTTGIAPGAGGGGGLGHGRGRTGSTASSSLPRLSPPTTPGTPGGLKRKMQDRDEEDAAIGAGLGAAGLGRASSGSAKRKRTLEGSGHGAPQKASPAAPAATGAAGATTTFQSERRGSDESRSSRPGTGSSRASVANLVEEGGVGGVTKPSSNPSSNGTSSTPTPGHPGK